MRKRGKILRKSYQACPAWRRSFLLLAITLCIVPSCRAQRFGCSAPDASSTITTDRPSFTNASTVIPCRSLQFENGFLQSASDSKQGFDAPETLMRYGVTTSTEVRFTAPDYYQNTLGNAGFATGLGDLLLGIKQQVGPWKGFDLSLMASLSMPTGAHSVSSHGYDPTLQAPWSRKLSANWTAAGMFTVAWPTEGSSRDLNGQVSALFDRQMTKLLDAFVEYNGVFPEQGGPQHTIHMGGSYKVTSHQQLDFRLGFGLSSAAMDHLVGGGYSVRFDGLGSRR